MIEPITTPGKTYAVTSPNGCTVTQRVGEATIVNDVPAGVQTLLIAQAGRFEVSDDSAIVTECGGSAELVFTAATTRAASSGSGCDCGFTAEECDKLKLYASAEGRNIPISDDGEIVTQIGHTYTITAGEQSVTCTDADFNPLCEVAAHKQAGFVAPATAAYVDNVTCTVTEVFRAAAPIMLSGNGSGCESGGESGGESDLPAGYKLVEYLEGDGNQVIKTGLVPDERTGFSASIQMPAIPALQGEFYFAGTQLRAGYEGFWVLCRNAELVIQRGLFADPAGIFSIAKPTSTNILSRNDIAFNFKNNQLVEINGGEGITITNVSMQPQLYSFAIFCATYGSDNRYDYSAHFRIYNWQHSQGENIVRSYIPCLDETGAPCMYDRIEQKPYYNAGTGDFLYPTESTTYSLRHVLPDWGKLTENGLRRLYHAPADWAGELYDYAIEYGYKPIIEPERPEDGYWTPRWRETEEEIVLEWIETEAPEIEGV